MDGSIISYGLLAAIIVFLIVVFSPGKPKEKAKPRSQKQAYINYVLSLRCPHCGQLVETSGRKKERCPKCHLEFASKPFDYR